MFEVNQRGIESFTDKVMHSAQYYEMLANVVVWSSMPTKILSFIGVRS